MRRRDFVAGIGGALATWPLAARSQQAPLPLLGVLTPYSPALPNWPQRMTAFQQGLAEIGFVDGKNVAIDTLWGEGRYDRLPALAADLVRRRASVIVTAGTPATLAAMAATTTIPIVFTFASDPVALGLVASLAKPGGNFTGVTRLLVELAPKKLDLLKQIIPGATSMALLINPKNPGVADPERRDVAAAARAHGIELHVLEASDETGIVEAFKTALRIRAGAVLVSADGFFALQVAQLGALSLEHRMPAIFNYREFAAAGGLISYNGSLADSYLIAGQYAGRILKGEKPADIPVQQSTKIEMFINLKTARALGLTIPTGILVLADEVIE
jgi:putative tryptophan/tyrosine transport system substrate-binding protein